MKDCHLPQGTFEYTHMRCMILAIPARFWPFVIGELVRVTAPGGWIELFDGGQGCEQVGPNMQQMLTWGEQALAQRGFDVGVIDHLSTMLRQAGCSSGAGATAHHSRWFLGWTGRRFDGKRPIGTV